MRLKNLIIGDIKFQFKYGFYFIYIILTLIYVTIINALPGAWREKAATIMIFSDPAAIGLFFMGAIVLFEKSERVLDSIAISPVKIEEYIISKVISLGLISTVVGTIIALSSSMSNLFTVVLGVFLGSTFFTLLGLIIAANTSSLNQFLAATVPVELLSFLPPIFYMFGYDKAYMLIHPGCIIIRFIGSNSENMLLLLIVLLIWILVIYLYVHKYIERMFQTVGGIKL